MYSPFKSVQDFVTVLHNAYINNSRNEKEMINNRLMVTPLALAHKCLLSLKENDGFSSVYMNLAKSIPSDKSKTDYFMRYVNLIFYPERNQEQIPSMMNKFTNQIEYSITIENYKKFIKSLKVEYATEIRELDEIKAIFENTCKIESSFVDMIEPNGLKV